VKQLQQQIHAQGRLLIEEEQQDEFFRMQVGQLSP
jgi:hypothetical protein